ncbi:MAG: MFS transporter [Deltaproteobacteria bacterium]|nr:MFS transporter [Deltaproteobacteria bacterium]
MNVDTALSVEEKRTAFFYGWVVVGVGFVTLGMAFGVWYSFSVFFLAVIEEFGWSRAATSSIFSVFIFSQSMVGLLAGHLQDRFGPRVIIPFGTVVLCLCLAVTSRAHSLWHFYIAYGVFAGAAVSLLGFSSHAGFIPKWFERQRGLALGIAMSGIGFGMLIFIPLAEKSITLFGWRNTYLYMAAVLLLTVGPLNAFLSRRSPQDMGLMPDGDSPDRRRRDRRVRVTIKVVDEAWAGENWTLKKAVRTKRFWLLAVAFFFGSWVYQGTLLHSISAMVDFGLERHVAASYFGILGIAGAAGKIVFGYLSDVLGRERVNTLAGVVTALGLLCLMSLAWVDGIMPLLFAVSFGLGYGAAAPLFPSVSADIFLGRSFGLIFAVICIGGGLGGSMGPFMTGYLRDITGSYMLPFALFFASLTLSCLFIWMAGPRKVRRMVRN